MIHFFSQAITKYKSTGGRNNQGRITSRRMGGGTKKSYRKIDFKRNKFDVKGEVLRIEHDPNRSAFIALIKYDDNEHRYILSINKLKIGDKIIFSGLLILTPKPVIFSFIL